MWITKLKPLALAMMLALMLTSCQNSAQILGRVALKGEEEATFDVVLPSTSDIRWRLRFGLLPFDKINALKPTDQITVYLENKDSVSIGFSEHPDKPKVTILPGEKIKAFQGTLSDLIMSGRGEFATMVFDATRKKFNTKLYFVPHLEGSVTYAMQVSIFYNYEGL